MMTPKYFRDQAARCRRLAGETHSREFAERLLETADEYLRLAENLEIAPQGAPLPIQSQRIEQPLQQQQQQQQQIQPDDKDKE
jgi:hypothetical protein